MTDEPGLPAEDAAAELRRVRKRLERTQRARADAERIAEQVTRELYERQQALALLERVASAANQSQQVNEALAHAIEAVCLHTGWPVGTAWLRAGQRSSALVSSGVWHLDDAARRGQFMDETALRRFQIGEGLPGRVLESGQPAWIEDIAEDENFPRSTSAAASELRSALAAPIHAHSRVVGVLEFFSEQRLAADEQLLGLIAQVGLQLGRVVERRQSEEQLRSYQERLEELVGTRTAALTSAQQELRVLSEAAANQLRAPLRAINGFGRALEEEFADRLGGAGVEHIHRIRAATVRMGQLIDGVLTLARIRQRDLRPEQVDVSALAREVAHALSASDPSRAVDFVITEGLEVFGDAELLRMLLEQLFDNAWKATRRRAPARIELSIAERGGEAAWYVRDNGIGLDIAHAAELFRAFAAHHDPTEFDGIGVGLAAVERIVERHQGRAWADGETGVGATIWFTLG